MPEPAESEEQQGELQEARVPAATDATTTTASRVPTPALTMHPALPMKDVFGACAAERWHAALARNDGGGFAPASRWAVIL